MLGTLPAVMLSSPDNSARLLELHCLLQAPSTGVQRIWYMTDCILTTDVVKAHDNKWDCKTSIKTQAAPLPTLLMTDCQIAGMSYARTRLANMP